MCHYLNQRDYQHPTHSQPFNCPNQKDYGNESKNSSLALQNVERLVEKMKHCEYCGKEISDEEYEQERYGYCDECTDNLMTEEEEELWGL